MNARVLLGLYTLPWFTYRSETVNFLQSHYGKTANLLITVLY
jgi:hypothetical protein